MQAVNHSLSNPSSRQLLSIGDAAERLGVSVSTLRTWTNEGSFVAVILPSGHRRYKTEDVLSYLGEDLESVAGDEGGVPVAIISRVSSQGQANGKKKGKESDLTRQEARLAAWVDENIPNATTTTYSRVASGLNYENATFLRLIDDLLAGKFRGGYAVCTHRDRVARFGFALIERIAAKGGCKLIVIGQDENEEKTLESEITEDVLAVLTHYTAKVHGARSAKTLARHVTPECVRRMIELRQRNTPIGVICKILDSEGFRAGSAGQDPSEYTGKVNYCVVRRLLDSNGTEETLMKVIGIESKGEAIDRFLAEKVVVTGNPEDTVRNGDFHKAYSEWAEGQGVQAERMATVGLKLRQRGLKGGIGSGGVRFLTGIRLRA